MADLRLIYGFHAVTSRIRQNPDGVMEVYLQAQRQDPRMRDLIKLAEANGVRIIPVEAKRLDGMAGNARHQGVAARVDAARRVQHLEDVLDTLEEPPLLLVLDGVQDPHNLGACLRSADAFEQTAEPALANCGSSSFATSVCNAEKTIFTCTASVLAGTMTMSLA